MYGTQDTEPNRRYAQQRNIEILVSHLAEQVDTSLPKHVRICLLLGPKRTLHPVASKV